KAVFEKRWFLVDRRSKCYSFSHAATRVVPKSEKHHSKGASYEISDRDQPLGYWSCSRNFSSTSRATGQSASAAARCRHRKISALIGQFARAAVRVRS